MSDRSQDRVEDARTRRHEEAVLRIRAFRGPQGLALGHRCDHHGVAAGAPCWDPRESSQVVCDQRLRQAQCIPGSGEGA